MAMTSAWQDVQASGSEESFDEAFDGCTGMSCDRSKLFNRAQQQFASKGGSLYGTDAKKAQGDAPRSKTATARYQVWDLGAASTQGETPGVAPLGNAAGGTSGYREQLVDDDQHLRFVRNGSRFSMGHAVSGPAASIKMMRDGGYSSTREVL